MLPPDWLARHHIEPHSLDMRQFADFRQSTLPNGMRFVEAYNASGLHFTILPDRGLDIWTAHYNGAPLTWVSPGSPRPPDEGDIWLRLFPGGLLTTCGLQHSGPPEIDPDTGQSRDLHGRYTRLRTDNLNISGGWNGTDYTLTLSGAVHQGGLFAEHLQMERTYRLTLGDPAITVEDRVTNLGDQPSPLMVLYHINVGYPLVRAGATFTAAHASVCSRDAEAAKGFDRWAQYDAAIPGYAEQVYFHHPVVDVDGWSQAALLHESFGLQVSWDAAAMPYLTQWKNVRQGIYVCGIEPANCLPIGQNTTRESGRLVTLAPGAAQDFRVRIAVLDGAEAVIRCRQHIDDLRLNGDPVAGCDLGGFA